MPENYDTSWDLIESDEGYLPVDEDAFERKYLEWQTRDWALWLKENLTFPFTVERMEDEDDAYFTDIAKHQPFRLGHSMKVIGVEPEEDDRNGVIVQVKEGRRKGYVPLCDLEVTVRDDRNFWPVREYVVWFANRA
jgi:hypothetical protein